MSGIDLDHVAIATTDIAGALGHVVGDLGAVVVHGGDGYGFRWVQVRLGTPTTGMTVELLVVWKPEVNDFLARFIAGHGVGVHHMTFKVDDLAATLEHAKSIGLHPLGVSLENPQWREAFLAPREAHGTVIQLAQTDHGPGDFTAMIERATATGAPEGSPIWWPPPPAPSASPTVLRRVVLGSPARTRTTEFFTDFLGGSHTDTNTAGTNNTDTGTGADVDGTDLVWPGGGRIRIVDAPTAGVLRLEGDGPAARVLDLSGIHFTGAAR